MGSIQDLRVSEVTWHSAVIRWKFANDRAISVILVEECLFSSDRSKFQTHYRGRKKSCKVDGLSPDTSYTFTLQIDAHAKKLVSRGATNSSRTLSRENSGCTLRVKSNERNTRYRLSPVPNIVVTPSDDEEITEEEGQEEVLDEDEGRLRVDEGRLRVDEGTLRLDEKRLNDEQWEAREKVDEGELGVVEEEDEDDMSAGVSASYLHETKLHSENNITSVVVHENDQNFEMASKFSDKESSETDKAGDNSKKGSFCTESVHDSTSEIHVSEGSNFKEDEEEAMESNGQEDRRPSIVIDTAEEMGGTEHYITPVDAGRLTRPMEEKVINIRVPSADKQKLVVRFRTMKSGKHDVKLVQAIENHHTAEVKKICKESPDVVNTADQTGRTPVMVAAQHGYSSIIQLLHQSGANLNGANTGGKTALMLGAYCGHEHIVSLLMDLGCNWRKLDNIGCSALHYAVERGSVEICRSLVNRGADVNIMDQRGYTPLMTLCLADDENTDMVTYLLDNKADPNLHIPGRETPLMAAVRTEKPDTARLLIENKANVKEMSKHGFTAHDMCKKNVACFKLISDNIESDDSETEQEPEETFNLPNAYTAPPYPVSG